DLNPTQLWYPSFNSTTNQFNTPAPLDDPTGDSGQHPAIIAYNGELWVFTNHVVATNTFETRMWRSSIGLDPLHKQVINSEAFYNGYPTVPERLSVGVASIPYVYGQTDDVNNTGTNHNEVALRVAVPSIQLSFVPENGGNPVQG